MSDTHLYNTIRYLQNSGKNHRLHWDYIYQLLLGEQDERAEQLLLREQDERAEPVKKLTALLEKSMYKQIYSGTYPP